MSTYAKATPHTPSFPEVLTVSEVAQILRVDDTTVRRWVKQGMLACVFLPHRSTKGRTRQGYRITRAAIDSLFDGAQAS